VHIFYGAVDVIFGQHPIVIEIGNHLFHEWFGQPNRKSFVAEMIVKDSECELLRACTFVGPLEAPFCELFDFVMLGERTAINRHAKPVDLPRSLICLHRSGPAVWSRYQMLGYRLPACKANREKEGSAESHLRAGRRERSASQGIGLSWSSASLARTKPNLA
jgi:hypothetical protein